MLHIIIHHTGIRNYNIVNIKCTFGHIKEIGFPLKGFSGCMIFLVWVVEDENASGYEHQEH